MKQILWACLLLQIMTEVSCMHKTLGPLPEKHDKILEIHGDQRHDPYFWLRERENPKVVDHLKKENEYLEKTLEPVKKMRDDLFAEMKGRIKEKDDSAPVQRGAYTYQFRYLEGKQYPIWLRKKTGHSTEEILLDENQLAEGKPFLDCEGPFISPDQTKMAYACDFVGRRFYQLHIKDLKTQKDTSIRIPQIRGGVAWAADNKTLFTVVPNEKTLRAEKIIRVDTATQKFEDIYFEKDETFSVGVSRGLSQKFIFIESSSTLSTETRFLPSDQPLGKFQIFLPREPEHEYSIVDQGNSFVVMSNWQAPNFRIFLAPQKPTPKDKWKEIIPHRADTFISDFVGFKNKLVFVERKNGLDQIVIRSPEGKDIHSLNFPDPSYELSLAQNVEYNSPNVRFNYQSMRLPSTVFDCSFENFELKTVKVKEVIGYNAAEIETARIQIKARDGTTVPASLAWKKSGTPLSERPMLVYGYGSYGHSTTASFSSEAQSLMNRGFIVARAHIRGGSELGRTWYDQGRTSKKMNTFYDFIDVTEGLVREGFGDKKRLYALGGSAGGLLMGAVINLRPDLYRSVVAAVPFVDVITTMLDETIPLTTFEFDEWGNPKKKEEYAWMKQYSPYDLVKKEPYPNLLVTTGFHDSQVQYWEPAKWVAKIREMRTNNKLTLMRVDFDSGHGGASGRFEHLKDTALIYAFLIYTDSI